MIYHLDTQMIYVYNITYKLILVKHMAQQKALMIESINVKINFPVAANVENLQ